MSAGVAAAATGGLDAPRSSGDGATPRSPRAYDVVIVGAGPAGSSAAIWLARRGARVALLERSRFDAPRVGEALAPDVQGELRALGAWGDVMALGPLPSWGTRSLWGAEQAEAHSHLVSPYSCGWSVDRRAFDQALAEVAARAGAQPLLGATLRATDWLQGAWRLEVSARRGEPAASMNISARVLIDASGRSAAVGRALGARRHVFDRLVGVATCWARTPRDERHLLVEASGEGWWYSAPLPPGARDHGGEPMLAMLMTDGDLCAQGRQHRRAGWHAALAATRATRERLLGASCLDAPCVHPAHSQRVRRAREVDARHLPWLAVGDAALAVDPLSGSGVSRALRSGRAGAETAAQLLESTHDARDVLGAYDAARDAECTTFLIERAGFYGAEERFDTPFWQRRRG